MSYDNDEGTSPVGNLLTYLLTGVLLVYIWNGLVWLFFRHLGWGYVPINLWTPFLGWVMLVAFSAPALMSCFPVYQGEYAGTTPDAWMWSFLTVPLMLLFLRAFPRTE